MKKFVSVLSALLACIAISGIAHAGTTTANFQVSINIVPDCEVSAIGVNFGNVIADGAYHTANGDVQVNCPSLIPYNIALDAGMSWMDDQRNLYGRPGNILQPNYELYKDSAYSVVWGDSDYANTYSLGTSLADIGNGSWQSHTIYGRTWGNVCGWWEECDLYSDWVIVTVYF